MSTIINKKVLYEKDPDFNVNKTTYDWEYIFSVIKKHKKQLLLANLIAIIATIASIPVPLLMPLLSLSLSP